MSSGPKERYRKAISIKGNTYERLRQIADSRGCSVASLIESWANEALDAAGEPVPERSEPRRHGPPRSKPASGVHEF